MGGCNWMHNEGRCTERAKRADRGSSVCHAALRKIDELKQQQVEEQLDLFQPVDVQAEIDFWWTVHAAGAAEYKRMARIFHDRCQHPYRYRPLGAS